MKLFELAKRVANSNPEFQFVKGPGAGNRATNGFLREIRKLALDEFGEDFSEQRICGQTSQAVDFYFPAEGTIVEVALGLPNPASEFEKDILKAIMAKENGCRIRQLVFISRPGSAQMCQQPGRVGFISWARARHGISIKIYELDGEPRRRVRKADALGGRTAA